VHDYLADLDSEVPLYMKAGQLIKFLSTWTPPIDSLSPQETVLRLAVDLYQHCYWEVGDVELTKAWIGDLATLGHEIPQFNRQPLPTRGEENRCAEKVSC